MKRVPETDQEALRRKLRFVRRTTDPDPDADDRLVQAAKAFEAQLFREYALADLGRYQNQQIGLRWRTARECQAGKGETSCGALDCAATEKLSRLELPFTYREEGTKLTTLVKVTMCPSCAEKVAFIAKKQRKKKKRRKESTRAERGEEERDEGETGITPG